MTAAEIGRRLVILAAEALAAIASDPQATPADRRAALTALRRAYAKLGGGEP